MTTFRIHERGAVYDAALAALERRGDADLERVECEVRAILADVETALAEAAGLPRRPRSGVAVTGQESLL